MPKLVFKIASDWEEVVKLRNEITKLKQELKGMDGTQSPAAFKTLNTQLSASTQRMDELVTNAAKAGAVMEGDFKKKIFDASQTVNGFTERIIAQKNAVGSLQSTIRKNKELYKTIVSRGGEDKELLNHIREQEKALGKERDSLFRLTQQQAEARLSVKKLRDEYTLYKNDSTKVISANDRIASSMKEFILTIVGADAIKDFISNVIDTAGNFQKMEAVLANSLGSTSKAKETMDMLADFGAKTPFQVDELTAAYVKLANQGFTPTMTQMRKLGDLASSTGKSFDQLAEAIIDAQVGENERLKEFGIRASKNGDSITYTFKEQENTVKNTASAIREYILSLGDLEGVTGANEKISATFVGRLSNIQDELTNQFKNFGEQFSSELSRGINSAALLVENLNKIIPVIGGLVAAYGTYKAAVLAVSAAHKAGALYENIRLIGMMRKELGLATAAQQAFNTASKANIYATLLAALIGIGTAVYMFTKKTDKATESQKRLSNASVELNAEIGKEAKVAKDLFDKLKNAKKGTTEYSDAKQKVLDNYGKYISGMNKELDTIEKINAAYNESTKAVKRYVTEKLKAQFVDTGVGDASGKQAEALKMIRESLNKKYTSFSDALKGEYNSSKESEKAFNTVKELLIKDDISGASKLLFKDYGLNFMGDAGKALEQYKNAANEIKQTFKDADDLYSFKNEDTGSNTQSNVTKEITDITKKVATLKKEIADLRSGKTKVEIGKTVESVIEGKKKELQEAEKSLETLTGSSLTKQENQAEKLRQQQEKYNLLLDKQSLDRIRREEYLENQAAQARIDAMSDGFIKEQAQRKLNNKKEIQALERQKDDYIRAVIQAEREKFNANPLNKGKTFNASSVKVDTSGWDTIINDTKTKQGLNEWEQREASMNEYLLKYGTFTQKKEALDKKYRDAIDKEGDLGKKNILQKEWEEAVSSLDMDKLKQEINWELVFGDLSKVSKKSLEQVKSQLKAFKDSAEYQNMTVEQKKVVDEALNNIQSSLIDKGGLLGDLPEQLDALRIAQEELAKAQEEYDKALENGTDAEKEAALKKKNNAEKNVQSAQTNVTKSADKTTENLISLANTITQLGSSSEMTLTQIGNLVSGLIDTFTEAGSKIGGIVGAAFSLLDAIDKQGLDGFVKNIFSSVFNTSRSVWDTITFGAFSKLTGSGESDKNLERDIEYLTQSNQDLKNALDNLSEKMDKASVAEASDIYEVQKRNIETQEANTREAMQRSGVAYSNGFLGMGGSHSSNDKINKGMSASEWKRVSEIVGRSVQSASQFFQLSSEQMAKLAEEDTSLYSRIKDLANDGYRDAAQYMDEYITYYKQLEELENAYNEKLTSISFDSVRNDFKNALLDMESDAEDFADSFEKMMQNAIFESLMTKKYDKLIQDWYKDFAKAMDNDKKIDEYEQRYLKNRWDDIVNKALAERDILKDSMGWDTSQRTSQSSTSKSFQAMSQDTGEELNGRFTALQIAGEEIKNQSTLQTQSLNLLTVKTDALLSVNTETRNIADETRDLIAQSYLELVQISENTGNSAKYLKDIKADIAEVKKNTSKL